MALVVVLCLIGLNMVFGNTTYSLIHILDVLMGKTSDGAFTILTLRLPRVLIGVLCGMAFGVAGNTFQRILSNSLASPDIIGVTAGSSVAAVFTILILHWSGWRVFLAALISGVLVASIIYFLSQGKGFSNARLILIGIGMQAFLRAIISWLLLVSSQYDVANALRWLNGSLNGVKLEDVPLLTIVVCIGVGLICILDKHLNVLQLGDSFAQSLGSNPHVIRLVLIILALLLSAFATSVSGPIASVAFLSGPIAKRFNQSGDNHILLSGLVGVVLVLASDWVGQYMLPSRYPVGVVTGILGAPYLLVLLVQLNKKGSV